MRILIFLFALILPFASVHAEKVCLKVSLKSGKIIQTVRKVSSAKKCAKGYSQIVDTQSLIGPTGPTGANGTTGANGVDGGFSSVLASGTTLTGTFGEYAITDTDYHVSTYSFVASLTAAPTANFRALGSQPNAACPGTATNPTATAGNLCLYEVIGNNRSGAGIFNPITGAASATKFGFGYVFQGTGGGVFTSSYGTWAVTAP